MFKENYPDWNDHESNEDVDYSAWRRQTMANKAKFVDLYWEYFVNILSILCFENIMSISIENIMSIFLTIYYQYLLKIFWQYFVNFFSEYSGNIFWQYYVNFYWEYFIKSNIPGVRPLSKQNQWRDSTQQSRERYHTLCLLHYGNEISLKQEYWKKSFRI